LLKPKKQKYSKVKDDKVAEESKDKTSTTLAKGAKHKNKEVAKIKTSKKGQLENFFPCEKQVKLSH